MGNLERHLATVLCADVKDYSRHMGANEETTVRRLSECRIMFDAAIEEHEGRIANTAGDSVVSEFSSATNAVSCAVKIQEQLIETGAEHGEQRLIYRIGIHLGEVITKGEDILGDTVNIAARLEGLADADGICISASVYDAVRNKLPFSYLLIGEQQLKNIDEPVKVFKVMLGKPEATAIQQEPASPALPDKPSVAVLPLDNMSSDPEQEYFSDGLTEDIITDLSKVSGLFVIARNSTFVYKNKSTDLRQVGKELGVKYLLEGSVRKGGDRLRITVQLIEAATGNHIWAERYDRVLTDIFEVQDEMTRTIVEALEVNLTRKEQSLIMDRGTANLKAYDLFIRGREFFFRYKRDAVVQSRQFFHEAIRIDPHYALAYAYLARTYIYDYIVGYVPHKFENLEMALPYVNKAIELDGNCARAYATLGWYHIWHAQASEGIVQLLKAIDLEPNGCYVHSWLSYGYAALEQGEAAINHANQALRLDPYSIVIPMHAMACAQFSVGKMDECMQSCMSGISQNSNFLPSHALLAAIYAIKSQLKESQFQVQEILRLSPNFSVGMSNFFSPETKSYQRLNDAIASLGFPMP